MKRVLLLMSNGVESFELAAFSDVMSWASKKGDELIEVTRAALHPEIVCTCGLRVVPDAVLPDVEFTRFDALAIPGGFGDAGFYVDAYSEPFLQVIRTFHQSQKLIGSICTGALPIAKAGALRGRRATTYDHGGGKRRRELAEMGVVVEDQPLVIDGNIITSISPATAIDSALALLEVLTSQENAEQVRKCMGF